MEVKFVDASSLVVDQEFRDYLPAAGDMHRCEMERQIMRDGRPEKPVLVWKGHGTIIDGHNRVSICGKHGIKVPVVYVDLPDRDAVKAKIDEIFLSQDRGISNAQYAQVLARHVDRLQKSGVVDAPGKVASERGISTRTVYRQMGYAEALGSLPADIRDRLVSGQLRASRGLVIELASYGELHQRNILAQLDRGDYKTLAEAVRGEGGEPEEEEDPITEEPPEQDGEEPDEPAVCDKVSQTPPRPPKVAKEPKQESPPKPSRKPLNDTFTDAQRQLSKVSAILDSLKGVTRDKAAYDRCRAGMKSLSDAIETWRTAAV